MKRTDKSDRGELREQLALAAEMRSSQDQVLWSIFGFFGATSALLLMALFDGGGFPSDPRVGAIISLVGAVFSVAWSLVQDRALRHIRRHEDLMANIERRLAIPCDLAVSPAINTRAFDAFLSGGIPARRIMKYCGIASAIMWVAGFGVFAALSVGS